MGVSSLATVHGYRVSRTFNKDFEQYRYYNKQSGNSGNTGANKVKLYSNIPDSLSVWLGKKFTKAQKDIIIQEIMKKMMVLLNRIYQEKN